eukprot:15221752-Alexandrium_andersonii.AAC.1
MDSALRSWTTQDLAMGRIMVLTSQVGLQAALGRIHGADEPAPAEAQAALAAHTYQTCRNWLSSTTDSA